MQPSELNDALVVLTDAARRYVSEASCGGARMIAARDGLEIAARDYAVARLALRASQPEIVNALEVISFGLGRLQKEKSSH